MGQRMAEAKRSELSLGKIELVFEVLRLDSKSVTTPASRARVSVVMGEG